MRYLNFESINLGDKKRSSRPRSLSDRNVRELKRLVHGENRISAAKIMSDLNRSLPKPVSKRTIQRYLTELGYEYVTKLK
jgi:transposase